MFNLILGFNETSDDASKAGKIFTASKFCFIFGNLKLELLVWLVIPHRVFLPRFSLVLLGSFMIYNQSKI